MVTLEEVRAKAEPSVFPRHILDGCETGLVLFAAGFHGAQDAIWLAEAGIQATCLDTDGGKLDAMALAYPARWEFIVGDAFAYAERTQRTWDVVTVDCPTRAFEKCAEYVGWWSQLAHHTVVLGSGPFTTIHPTKGWTITEQIRRSDYKGGTFWTVIQRAT